MGKGNFVATDGAAGGGGAGGGGEWGPWSILSFLSFLSTDPNGQTVMGAFDPAKQYVVAINSTGANPIGNQTINSVIVGLGNGSNYLGAPFASIEDTVAGQIDFDPNGEAQIVFLQEGSIVGSGLGQELIVTAQSSTVTVDAPNVQFLGDFNDNGAADISMLVLERARA